MVQQREVLSKLIDTSAAFSGQVTVAVAGTPVAGPAVESRNGFLLKAHPDNTDVVWFFHAGGTKADGFPLSAGEAAPLPVGDLSQVRFDADVNGEKICWLVL
jgi:hypothetical protein